LIKKLLKPGPLSIVTRLRAGQQKLDSWHIQKFLSSPPRSDRFWEPSSLLSIGYLGLFP